MWYRTLLDMLALSSLCWLLLLLAQPPAAAGCWLQVVVTMMESSLAALLLLLLVDRRQPEPPPAVEMWSEQVPRRLLPEPACCHSRRRRRLPHLVIQQLARRGPAAQAHACTTRARLKLFSTRGPHMHSKLASAFMFDLSVRAGALEIYSKRGYSDTE